MLKTLRSGASTFALLAGGLVLATGAVAQETGDEEARMATVVVTGSFIAGTPEDAALPVDVVTMEDLQLEGRPTITELIRNLGVSSGVDGQTNQFASNGLEGTSNINLRGLGAARTLVLLNGRRQTNAPYAIGEQAQLFVDTNNIPTAAIGRIEVLKDGAAALYGSDAIAGVVNFITRTDLQGFDVGAEFQTFDGSDGEYNLSAAWGWADDNANFLISAGYQYRPEVLLPEKDWAIRSITENPVGGISSLSNPGRYVVLGLTGAPIGAVNDAGCLGVGGIVNPATGQCNFQFTQFDSLVEEEERYQIFSQYNREFGNGVEMHLEALYASTDVPSWKTSPSYPPQVLTNQFLPVNHPGLQAYVAANPSGAVLGAGIGALYIGRTFGWGGFPGTGGAQEGFRRYETMRLGGGFKGEFANGVTWDTALTWSQSVGERLTNDTYIQGLTAALRGFGVCTNPITGADPATGTLPWAPGYAGSLTPGGGSCEWYNPFSNAIAANAITGVANPGYVPGLENSLALADWMTDPTFTEVTTGLLVFDAVMSGQSPLTAPGGNVGWAAGFQVRRESYEVIPSDLTDLAKTPGPGGTGPFSFLAGTNAADEEQTIYAAFGELQIPLYDDLDVQVAVRYEDYGDNVGSTFDPKVAAKWQVTDAFSLRGSAQTSFRGPTLNQLSGTVTTLQFVAPASAFKAVDQFGNPGLTPESAFSFNLGAIYQSGGFSGSIDYYNFDFSDPIIVEEQANIVNAAVAAIAAGDLANPILGRITFNGGVISPAQIARIRTNVINGPDIQTSGVDIRAQYEFDNVGGGDGALTLGLDATWILEYEVAPYFIEGVAIGGGDYVGQFNRSNFTRSMPQYKANLFANYAFGRHNLRAVVRHIADYDDERPAAARGGVGDTIDSQTTLDLFYSVDLPWEIRGGLSIVNVFDEDPPFAAFDTSYDPYTHNPFGRTVKVSLSKTFGQP